jgi:2-haloacid dehalogenase
MPPAHALFDLNGTLVDPSVIADELPPDVDRAGFVDGVLGDAVLLATIETITGRYRDFAELLRAAAARRLGADSAALDAIMDATQRMTPFPDALEGIRTLQEAGVGVGVLTNSSAETARSLLAETGLELNPVVGTEEVEAFKPDARVYESGVAATGREPAEVILLTAHWWDALGAKRAGLQTAWVSRQEATRVRVGPDPDYEADDLAAVARQIVTS